MIKGIYSAISAMVAGINKQILKSHNVANLETPGFKQVFTTVQEFQKTDIIPPGSIPQYPGQPSIGELGLGSMTTGTKTKFNNGVLQLTNQPLDVALQGNGFFRIKTIDGERYTRDGRFIRDGNDQLVTIDGNPVLNDTGNPIKMKDGDLIIDKDGTLSINNQVISKLGIAEFENPETQLEKDTENFFKSKDAPKLLAENTSVHQGYLEMSNVNIVDLVVSTKSYEAAQKIVQIQDDLLGKSIRIIR